MTKKIILFAFIVFTFTGLLQAQTQEELKAQKAEKATQLAALESQVAGLKSEIAGIDKQLVILPRWEKNAFGVLGLDFKGFNDWLARDKPNITSSSIGASFNAFANKFAEKSFWRNSANVNMGWIKFDDRDNPDDNDGFEQSADVINLSSLYGRNLTEKLAMSTLGEYRSTLLSNFNNPGYLDIGLGLTWTPITNLVVVAHPLNYNFVFANNDFEYKSSLGAKIVAEYSRKFDSGVSWRSNLSTFLSYEDPNDLSNWTWINGLGFNIWKGLGVGLELGLRKNKQEALASEKTDNPLQTYYVLGFSYNIGGK